MDNSKNGIIQALQQETTKQKTKQQELKRTIKHLQKRSNHDRHDRNDISTIKK